MAKRVSVDKTLFIVTLLLVFIGLIMVFSASAVMARERYGSAYAFLLRQSAMAVMGFIAMLIAMNVDYRRYKHPGFVFSLIGLTSLLLVAVFFLDTAHNTHRWIRFSFISLQPSELAKPAIILFLAYFLESRTRQMDDWRNTLVPAIIPSLIFCALIIKEPDLGTAIVCMLITGAVLYVAGMRMRWFAAGFAACLPVLYMLIFRVQWRYDRIMAFMDPYADPQGKGFHMIQSLIAVGTGGVTGMGLMEGKQKLFYLPEPHTDFIYAVTAEEFGLVGALVVVALFAIFLYRGMRTALATEDVFARYLATGITAMVVMQALFNISVVLGLLPTKGIPLPFISYGGTALLVTLASVGVLLNITQQTD
ncbi:MAG: putative lipid II flippase FtsW [Acidobacteriota bacterium]|nr:putative lipid II flippase FtsW [Acidobacteriota bacterium]